MKSVKMSDYIRLGYYDENCLKASTFSVKRLFASVLAAVIGVSLTPAVVQDDDVVFGELTPPEGYVLSGISPYDGERINTSYDYAWFMKDAKENGLESWGADHLLKNVIGPIDEIKLGPEDTIEKVARYICLLRYGGIDGKEEWEERREYAEILYQALEERCKKINGFDMKTKRWTLKRSEATGAEKKIDFTNRKIDLSEIADSNGALKIANSSTDKLCALRLILKYLLEHNPNEIADEVMLELYPLDTRSEALETDLFN